MVTQFLAECLAYDDVNIAPAYSEVETRKNGITETRLTKNYMLDIPLIASPMDTVCELDMAKKMWELGGVGIIHRFMDIETQARTVDLLFKYIRGFALNGEADGYYGLIHTNHRTVSPVICAAIGVQDTYLERAKALLKAGANVLLIDVAHGHHGMVKSAMRELSQLKGEWKFDVIAGSIATAAGAMDLIEWGADALRVGIGNGCFISGTEIRTETGLVKIEEINVGMKVYTHTGELNQVIDKLEFDRNEEIISINDINCTKNHEFYVVAKSDAGKVTDENIHQFAKWIAAEKLDENWCLVELDDTYIVGIGNGHTI